MGWVDGIRSLVDVSTPTDPAISRNCVLHCINARCLDGLRLLLRKGAPITHPDGGGKPPLIRNCLTMGWFEALKVMHEEKRDILQMYTVRKEGTQVGIALVVFWEILNVVVSV